MTKEVSIKALQNEVMKVDCNNIGVKGIVKRLELLNQELFKNLGDNNESDGKYMEMIIRQVTTKYLRIGLEEYLRMKQWGIKKTSDLDPYNNRNSRNWTNRELVVM